MISLANKTKKIPRIFLKGKSDWWEPCYADKIDNHKFCELELYLLP